MLGLSKWEILQPHPSNIYGQTQFKLFNYKFALIFFDKNVMLGTEQDGVCACVGGGGGGVA